MKIPKLADLTDLNKLKQMGASLAESAHVGDMMGKVKQAVGDPSKLIDKAKSTVGLGSSAEKETATDQAAATPAAQIHQSLAAIFAAQKAQLAAMNQLKQAVTQLLKQLPEQTTTSSTESPTTGDTEPHKPDDDSDIH